MSEVAIAPGESGISLGEVARIWLRHLVSVFIPLNALIFLWTGPHSWYVAPLFFIPIGIAYALDGGVRSERRQPHKDLPAWPFDTLVYLLAGLQFWTILELARVFSVQAFFSIDMLTVFIVVGASSGFSIITAHELIHRKLRWQQGLGRLLLCTVLNEHFYTEHLRGHHVRVGTPEDPATARFGESYEGFYWRTIREQFAHAWRLELDRLGNPRWTDRRFWLNRVVHGQAIGWGLALAILLWAGPVAFAAFLLQAFSASRLLEAVNYFEHWGLRRRARRVRPVDSWDTHSWFTYYGLTGLSRHADHHAEPARPFQQLRVMDDAPVLPGGYVRMVDLATGRNAEFQRAAVEELKRKQLGPFAEDAAPDELATSAEAQAAKPHPVLRAWSQLSIPVRRTLALAVALVAFTLGAQWEAADGRSLAAAFGAHLWILAVFAAALVCHAQLAKRIPHEGVCWAAAFAVLIGLGRFGDALLF